MEKTRIAFRTLGCKLNFAETSSLARDLQADFEVVDFKEVADFYVIQSCVVTATAEKKCRSTIRQAHKRNPIAKVAVLGCMSQLRASSLSAMPEVSLIIGNADKHRLKEIFSADNTEASDRIKISEILKDKHFYPAYSSNDRTRLFIKIQDGCDYFCSYCTIPYARGRSRSDTIAHTIETFRSAIEQEHPKEIVFTGVNIGDFGKPHNERFGNLLVELDKIEEVDRFRLSSLEPDLLDDEIIEFVAKSRRFMPHFHLPLQSGSDTVLKRMHRRYDTHLFRNKVLKIKELMPFACIAVDVIAGYPGETEEEFEETFQLINELPVSYLHVFPYSERPGTLAAKSKYKVSAKLITDRSHRLLTLSGSKKKLFNEQNSGRTELVLFESQNNNNFMYGFTTNYIRVKATFDEKFINQVKLVTLDSVDSERVYIFHAKN
ncbi:MAG: tRNA (N(6)-L-threonylcarbamoyladenosine(37)-C(2))-methylthiotransferase MtaB [Bacteroidales bacterium]|nr:tRNA (N(6)-L-threonylcarbamoyladenosine(37)-C(2))-methylthiotransferase MtaB [Bacteroidales bacterium]MDZ4205421.1 tRNA (N(6)-L-threonylcarbamoyladenosine(37)-C(2))-methylthiotransferase MtaB [Bacteroidales bacterium]